MCTYQDAFFVSLHVYCIIARPLIIESPQPVTTTTERSVTFKCVAQGHPPPAISWKFKNTMVTNSNPNFNISFTTRQDGRLDITTSYFRIYSVDSSMNGEVRCIATPPQREEIGGLQIDSVSETAQLTVLGRPGHNEVMNV